MAGRTVQLPGSWRALPKQHFSFSELRQYLFVLPAVLFLTAFLVYPILFNVKLSFQEVRADSLLGGTAPFVGLQNYAGVLASPLTRTAALNSVLFTASSLTFQLLISFPLALLYQRKFPGSNWMRSLYLLGWSIPVMVSGTMFKWLFEGDSGLVNYLLQSCGLINAPIFWTADPSLSLWSTVVANIWLGIPFNLTLIYAALQTIPTEVYEAAALDGARKWAKFCFITLPLVRPALLSILLLGLIYTVKQFDLIWIMTQGGPIDSSQLVSTAAYKYVFEKFQFGYGSALLNMVCLFLFAVTLLYLMTLRRETVR
jgi:multiple sugar transport system permease protein